MTPSTQHACQIRGHFQYLVTLYNSSPYIDTSVTVADGESNIDTAEKASSGSAPGVIAELRLSQLECPSTNPRFGGLEIDKLAQSIKSVGLLQPIIVRPKNNHYEVIAGNRRLAACRALKWRKISCHVIDLDDKSAIELSLIENIQRQTIDPLEEAEAFRSYVEQYGWGSAMQLAAKLGKSSAYISKRISLLNLSADVIKESNLEKFVRASPKRYRG